MANTKTTISDAFKRSSSAISIVIVVAFATMMLSTAYNMLAFSPSEFAGRPDVQEYENALRNVSTMDEWARTRYYWFNNLKVAWISGLATPTYFGFNSTVFTNYTIGMAVTYVHHTYGSTTALAFLAQIFVHGLLELTGFYIIAAVTLRAAWSIWKGFGRLIEITGKDGKRWAWKLTKREKREILKHRPAIELLVLDFITLLAIGAFFIFLAAPVEAYISPEMGYLFASMPAFAVVFLVSVGVLYASIAAWGFNAMRIDLKFVWKSTRSAFKRKWRPAQLSLLMFTIFFTMTLLNIIL